MIRKRQYLLNINYKRRNGSMLVEVLISMLVFTVAIMALAASFTITLKTINRSFDTTMSQRRMFNESEKYILGRLFTGNDSDMKPNENYVFEQFGGEQAVKIGNRTVNFHLYRVKLKDKASGSLYFIRGNSHD